MKKFIVTTIIALSLSLGYKTYAQQLSPVMPRGYHSYQSIKEWTMSGTNKVAKQYRTQFIQWFNASQDSVVWGEERIPQILAMVKSEEMTLREGAFWNTGVNARNELKTFLGHQWTGFVGVIHFGSFRIPIWKDDCANLIYVPQTPRSATPVVQPAPEALQQLTAKKPDPISTPSFSDLPNDEIFADRPAENKRQQQPQVDKPEKVTFGRKVLNVFARVTVVINNNGNPNPGRNPIIYPRRDPDPIIINPRRDPDPIIINPRHDPRVDPPPIRY